MPNCSAGFKYLMVIATLLNRKKRKKKHRSDKILNKGTLKLS